MYLADKVVNYTRGRQHPQYGKINNPNLDRGDFIFVASELRTKAKPERKSIPTEEKSDTQTMSSVGKTKDSANLEITFWNSIKDSDDIRYFEEYLRKFPNGTFAGLAGMKIESLSHKDDKRLADKQKIKESTQASVIPHSSEDIKPVSKIRLAIFPWQINTSSADLWFKRYFNEKDMINIVSQVLKENNKFVPDYSYYELGRNHKAKRLTDAILSDTIIDDLWVKEGVVSNYSPNIELISELGNQLQVDAVLFYKIKGNTIYYCF